MPRYAVVAVRDSAVESFNNPFAVPHVGGAVRSFGDEVNRRAPDNPLAAHPDDYELHLLAEFDSETGVFDVPEGGRRCLARGKDLVQKAE